VHAAMLAERMLRHASLEGVDRQGILAVQQLEIRRKDREMQNSLLDANGATTLRQLVQIDPGAEPHLAAVTASFASFQHVAVPFMIPPDCHKRRGGRLSRLDSALTNSVRAEPLIRAFTVVLSDHCLFGDTKVDELAQHLTTLQIGVSFVDIVKFDVT
jgi:hypothetical protein